MQLGNVVACEFLTERIWNFILWTGGNKRGRNEPPFF